MSADPFDYDVVIAGAGIGGCAAATLFGRGGARVALVERRPDPSKHKVTCTHLFQSSSVPTLERLGLLDEILAAGGVPCLPQAWTPWGWVRPEAPPPDRPSHDVNIRREKLDPLMRRAAAAAPGVELMLGQTVDAVLRDGQRVAGVAVKAADGTRRELRARLTVGADGRDSRVARLAGRPGRVKAHGRSSFWAYYSGVRLPSGPARFYLWFLDPGFAAVFPTDDGLALVSVMIARERSSDFKRNLEANFVQAMESLPDAPRIADAKRESKIIGKIDMPNVARQAAGRGLAFVGDAALAADPLNAVGCGWALQSAEWLVDETAGAVTGHGDLEASLRRYRRRHARALGPHYMLTSSYATGRRFNPAERLVLSAAARDHRMAAMFEALGSRNVQPTALASPGNLARAAGANLRHRLRRREISRALDAVTGKRPTPHLRGSKPHSFPRVGGPATGMDS